MDYRLRRRESLGISPVMDEYFLAFGLDLVQINESTIHIHQDNLILLERINYPVSFRSFKIEGGSFPKEKPYAYYPVAICICRGREIWLPLIRGQELRRLFLGDLHGSEQG